MEADISTLRKTGHFYFALTDGKRGLTSLEAGIRIELPFEIAAVATGCPLTAFRVTCGIAVPFPTWC